MLQTFKGTHFQATAHCFFCAHWELTTIIFPLYCSCWCSDSADNGVHAVQWGLSFLSQRVPDSLTKPSTVLLNIWDRSQCSLNWRRPGPEFWPEELRGVGRFSLFHSYNCTVWFPCFHSWLFGLIPTTPCSDSHDPCFDFYGPMFWFPQSHVLIPTTLSSDSHDPCFDFHNPMFWFPRSHVLIPTIPCSDSHNPMFWFPRLHLLTYRRMLPGVLGERHSTPVIREFLRILSLDRQITHFFLLYFTPFSAQCARSESIFLETRHWLIPGAVTRGERGCGRDQIVQSDCSENDLGHQLEQSHQVHCTCRLSFGPWLTAT